MTNTHQLNQSRRIAGDTIVEVLLATVIMSFVVVGAYTLTNRSTRANQTAYEKTIVSNLMREQLETIRSVRTVASNEAAWAQIKTHVQNTLPSLPSANCVPDATYDAFYVDRTVIDFKDSALIKDFTPTPDLYQIWVVAYQPNPEYIDFHTVACWEGIGGEGLQRTSFVLRLVE